MASPQSNDDFGSYARALFPFQGEFSNEISFGTNEMIKITGKVNQDWLEGQINGRTGMFPAEYVQITDFESDTSKKTEEPQEILVSKSFETRKELSEMVSKLMVSTRKADSFGNDSYARALFPFQGEFSNEISFGTNEMIKITGKVNQDWLEGQINGKTGIFPAEYVQIIDLESDMSKKTEVPRESPESQKRAYTEYSNYSPLFKPVLSSSFPAVSNQSSFDVFASNLQQRTEDIFSKSLSAANDSNTLTSGSTNQWGSTKMLDSEPPVEIVPTEIPIAEPFEKEAPQKTFFVQAMIKKINRIKCAFGKTPLKKTSNAAPPQADQQKVQQEMNESGSAERLLIDIDDCQPAIPMIPPLKPVVIASPLPKKPSFSTISEPTLNELRPIDWGALAKPAQTNPVFTSRAVLMNHPISLSPFTPTQTEKFFY